VTHATNASTNWFAQGGDAYARYRPHYPPALADYLASVAPRRTLAVDVGCGTGQLTTLLAERFAAVLGVDASADQVAHASSHPHVRYACAPAEHVPLAEGTLVDLVTVAQAAHWFDLPAFYAEVRRIAGEGAVLALVSYGVPRLPPDLDGRVQRFYAEEIGPFWPTERRLVDTGYADLDFPFDPLTPPPMAIEVAWPLGAWLGYVSTWSAVRRAHAAGRDDVLEQFANDLEEAWGDPRTERPISWPIAMRVGRVDRA
jgi:SAM-dependent methyltransferase